MSTYEWLLFLHVLSAAAVVASLIVLGAIVLSTRRAPGAYGVSPLAPLVRPMTTVFNVSGIAVLVLGIWLAFEADYGLGEPWIIAAIVLWLVAAGTGERVGRPYAPPRAATEAAAAPAPRDTSDARTNLLLLASTVSVLGMLVLMIFKPGAG